MKIVSIPRGYDSSHVFDVYDHIEKRQKYNIDSMTIFKFSVYEHGVSEPVLVKEGLDVAKISGLKDGITMLEVKFGKNDTIRMKPNPSHSDRVRTFSLLGAVDATKQVLLECGHFYLEELEP